MTGIRLAALLQAFTSGVLISGCAYATGRGDWTATAIFGGFALVVGAAAIVMMSREAKP